VSTVVSYVQTHGLDGVNVDFEDVIYFNETDRRLGLTLLLQELSRSLKSLLPKSQVCSVFGELYCTIQMLRIFCGYSICTGVTLTT